MRVGAVCIEFNRPLELLFGACPVIFKTCFFRSQRRMGLGQPLIQFQSSGSRCPGLWKRLLGGRDRRRKIRIGKSGIPQREAGVFLDRLLEILDALFDPVASPLAQVETAFEGLKAQETYRF
jgi:hypothetical protein